MDAASSLLSSNDIDSNFEQKEDEVEEEEEQYYRGQLERIFGDGHWEINASDPARALSLLQACPRLASETFEDAGGEWLSPLCFFLTSRSALTTAAMRSSSGSSSSSNDDCNPTKEDLLRQVYHLYPDAISQVCGNDQELPLHVACWRALPRDIVEFLAQAHPEGLLHRTNNISAAAAAAAGGRGRGLLPIHLALIRAGRDDSFRAAALEVVQALLEMFPEHIPRMLGPEGESLLEYVFSLAYRQDLVDLILQWTDHSTATIQRFAVDRTSATETASPALDLKQATILGVQLLPHLMHFECSPRQWTNDAFVFLMECLQNNAKSLESLSLRLSRDILVSSDPTALSALEQMLQNTDSNNHNLKKISLSGGRTVEELQRSYQQPNNGSRDGGQEQHDDTLFLQVLASSLRHLQYHKQQSSSPLKIVLLSDFVFPDKSIKTFLTSSGILSQQKLALSHVAITTTTDNQDYITESNDALSNGNNNHNNNSNYTWDYDYCECTSVTLFNCLMLPTTLKSVLNFCSRMPSLKQLAVGINNQRTSEMEQQVQDSLVGLDVTSSVVQLLEQAPQLQELIIRGPAVSTAALANVLKRNTTLRNYFGTPLPSSVLLEQELALMVDTLEHYNTKLEGFDLDLPAQGQVSQIMQARISYFTKLNDFGRRPLRKGFLKRGELVEFLRFAAENQEFEPVDVINVHYGLLRELPTLWCHGHSSLARLCGTKRKCHVCLDCCTNNSQEIMSRH